MKKKPVFAVVIWVIPSATLAGYYQGDYLRFSTGYSYSSLVLDTATSQYSQSVSSVPLTIEYQSAVGFYSGIGYARNTVEEIDVDDVRYVVGESYSLSGAVIGHRFQVNDYSEYVGISYLATRSSDVDVVSSKYSIYSESDAPQYYGRVSLSYQLDDSVELFSFSGRHVWFLDPDVGLGYTWGIGYGNAELRSGMRADAAVAEFGFIIMFREDFY